MTSSKGGIATIGLSSSFKCLKCEISENSSKANGGIFYVE